MNEAMLSGESTPLLKESIELRPGNDKLDINGSDRNSVLFGGTKVLQATKPSGVGVGSDLGGVGDTPDGGCVATVLRTGFGTSQGQLVRTMIFATERVSANNFESFLFICFLLIFAIAASAYVWIKGEGWGFLSNVIFIGLGLGSPRVGCLVRSGVVLIRCVCVPIFFILFYFDFR